MPASRPPRSRRARRTYKSTKETLVYLRRLTENGVTVAEGRTWWHATVSIELLVDDRLKPIHIGVAAALARHTNRQTASAVVGAPRIAAELGLSENPVRKAIAKLVTLGYVEVELRQGKASRTRLCDPPPVPAEHQLFDPATAVWNHVRLPVALLDDGRVGANGIAIYAAAALLAERLSTFEIARQDLKHAAHMKDLRTADTALDTLVDHGYLKADRDGRTAHITWLPCPEVPAAHLVRTRVDAGVSKRATPSDFAAEDDAGPADDAPPMGRRDAGSEDALTGPDGPRQTGANPAKSEGVVDGDRTGADDVDQAAKSRGVAAETRGVAAKSRGLAAGSRAELDPPPSPSGRGGCGGDDSSIDVDAEPFDPTDRAAVIAYVRDAIDENPHALASALANFVTAVADQVAPDVIGHGELYRLALRHQRACKQPTQPEETNPL